MSNIVRRGGRCLLPISAFGNVQELLLLLDEYWSAHPELHNVPVLYASGLAYRGMQVYRTYIHNMNAHIRSRFSRDRNDNPFAFKHVRNLKDFRKWNDDGPCVMMATPQMLQGYQSRELLERWAPDRKNGLIITGYSIDGTMAKVSPRRSDARGHADIGAPPAEPSQAARRFYRFRRPEDQPQNDRRRDLLQRTR